MVDPPKLSLAERVDLASLDGRITLQERDVWMLFACSRWNTYEICGRLPHLGESGVARKLHRVMDYLAFNSI